MIRRPPRSTLFPLHDALPISKLMFEHAAGVPNAILQAEIENREAGHHHEAGEAEEQQHAAPADTAKAAGHTQDRKSTRLNSSHSQISYAVFCLEKKIKST